MRRARAAVLLMALGLAGACESTERDPERVAEEPVIEVAEDRTAEWTVEAEADDVLRAAGKLLAATRRFSFRAEIMEEQVLESGAKYDTSREAIAHVRRPDGLYVELQQADGARRLWYDGKTAAIQDDVTELYVLAEEPPGDLDGFLDFLVDRLQVSIPLADVVCADPYAAMREPARGGVHLGDALVRGTVCHHLGFGDGRIEWQIWVQKEGRPLIRKAVINYRDEPGAPRWEAHLSDWDLADGLGDDAFTFRPAEGAHRIQVEDSAAQFEDATETSEDE